MKIESTHLLTLSAFVDQQKEDSTVSARTAQEIILYNDFLKQELNVSMFDISSDEAFFRNFKVDSFATKRWFCLHEDCYVPSIVFCRNEHKVLNGPKTLADLAEATKEAPLKFRKQLYFDNEELY